MKSQEGVNIPNRYSGLGIDISRIEQIEREAFAKWIETMPKKHSKTA